MSKKALLRPCAPARALVCTVAASLLAPGTALRAAFDLLTTIDVTVDPERAARDICAAATLVQQELRARFRGCNCERAEHPDWTAAKRIMERLRAAHGACHAAALTAPLRELSRPCVRWVTCTQATTPAPLLRQVSRHHRFGRVRLHRL